MSRKMKRGFIPVAWLINIAIVFEILFMISPFAFYYYSTYGPSLNFLHNWSQTAWLTGFFLPHFTETSSLLINSLNGFGRILFLSGLCLFLIGAGQVYWILADLPLENIPRWVRGHHTPKHLDSNAYKILFTKAMLATDQPVAGIDIIKKTFGRQPIIVVKLNNATGEILALETPPPHVLWGDIPTPLF